LTNHPEGGRIVGSTEGSIMTMEFIVHAVHNSPIYAEIELECPVCGHEFVIDTETEFNMVLQDGDWVPQCPECNYVQLFDIELIF
jgi:hypothetical protein